MILTNKDELENLEQEINSCIKYDLHKSRTQTVFSRGNIKSNIIVVGEGPGQQEDEQGKPFVGRSGKLLDEAFIACGLDPASVYVCNIVKCRPPGNRTPSNDEINLCLDFLERQVKLVDGKVILALGNTAASTITNSTFGITKIRGKPFNIKWLDKIVIPTFHPSYILRNGGSGSEKFKLMVEDINLALNLTF